jgi:hypothetical protein
METLTIVGLVTALGAAIRGNWSPCGESLQAQIHPLGEASRGNNWGVTMAAFTLSSMVAGGSLTGVLGLLGSSVIVTGPTPIWITVITATAAGALDLSPLRPWTPKRQVNEDWIRRYRGWVYGAGFGVQLGLGFTVFVMSWGYWAMLAIAFLSGSFVIGVALGAAFGFGRGLLLLLSRSNTTPERLADFHRRMASAKGRAFGATAVATSAIALVALI